MAQQCFVLLSFAVFAPFLPLYTDLDDVNKFGVVQLGTSDQLLHLNEFVVEVCELLVCCLR